MSDSVCAPSATRAKLPEIIPMVILKIVKNIFPAIPIVAAFFPSLFRLKCSI
ncbi:hypothetical protein MBBAR_6c02360 [Methanobrevibacter arboriphilus JCM 13429 = DSM 1125]|uniref:Uncharacterized protein n=1 Tax=Methanobrevibacter arboriphilus JCM 13429 = DSM 1125 TaxID=1300164 RepID=A0A1V6N376_METAZ|nr:hypothetical protein MBBAR_6c02360 [Methanobrevibacter arboriphilus JCM 13429 = DSM 1125]